MFNSDFHLIIPKIPVELMRQRYYKVASHCKDYTITLHVHE